VTRPIAAAIALLVAAELYAVARLDRDDVLVVSGISLVVGLVAVRLALLAGRSSTSAGSEADERAAALQRWAARTETMISWSDSTRADWDRRLRPMLARQFELATGQRKARNASAFEATGRMLFGPQLWQWVDPENVSRTGDREPGPGRGALDEILQRLERV
jgi:NADPH:quinone reductase-like Zn-dependent oxidoreductase